MGPKSVQNDSENRRINKSDIYQEFVTWFSIPSVLRRQTGIEDQNDFAQHHGISKDTLSLWKKRPDFEPRVQKIRDDWAHDRTADVFDAIYRGALKGRASSQRLWMKTFWTEPPKETAVLFSPEDIRYFISVLPEPLQRKYTIFLRDLFSDARAYRDGKEELLKEKVALFLEEEKWLQEKRIKEDPNHTGKYL